MTTQSETGKRSNGHRQRGERPTLPPDTALEIVQTSLAYAKGAGLSVRIGNHQGVCVIMIGGAAWDNDTQKLCVIPADDTQPAIPAENNGSTHA
jgi:hypothetical protein